MPTPTSPREGLPLLALTPDQRHALLRSCGMHSPHPEVRRDIDAFDVRADVDIDDACDTALHLVRAALAQVEMLAIDADLDRAHRDAVHGIACLVRLACGAIGVIQVSRRPVMG